MAKKIKIASLFLFLITGANATGYSQKTNFEQAERFTTRMMQKMTGSTEVDAEWIENSDRFWYSYENGEGKNWYFLEASSPSKQKLFDQDMMASKLTQILDKPFNSKDLPLKDFKYDTGKGLFSFHVDSIRFTYNISNNELIKGDTLKKKPETTGKPIRPTVPGSLLPKNTTCI